MKLGLRMSLGLLIDYDIATKQSDGIVLVESASTVLGMTFNQKMEGSNHFSMRNDENTRDRLQELYDGEYGSFFTVPER